MPTSLSVSNYVNRLPICAFSTDASGNIFLTVSGLRTTGTAPTYYGILFSGITTAPAARQNQLTGVTTTTQVTTYVGTAAKETINSNQFSFNYITLDSGVTLVGDPAQNNQVGTLTISFQTTQPTPAQGTFTIGFPAQNSQYAGLGLSPTKSMIDSISKLDVSGKYLADGGTTTLGTLTFTQTVESVLTYLKIPLKNGNIIPAGSVLTIVLDGIVMPPSLCPLAGVVVFTGDTSYFKVEYSDYALISNTLPGTEAASDYTSVASIETLTGVLETGQTYKFVVYLTGDLPKNGIFTLTVPSAIGLPADPTTGLALTCISYCRQSDITITYDSSTRILKFSGVVTSESQYIMAPGPLSFQIQGFTNPATAAKASFVFITYAVLDSGVFMIDKISSMYIQAEQGVCLVQKFFPTDGNYQIYGIASSWTVTMSCAHQVYAVGGLKIILPTDWYVLTTSSCVVGLQNKSYRCVASNKDGTVIITNFLSADVAKQKQFTFTFNSVRNPPVTKKAYKIYLASLSSTGGVVDDVTYDFSSSLITTGTIKKFTVNPQNYGVGQYPVYYDFVIQPSGEIYQASKIVITLGDGVSIYDQRQMEIYCSYNLTGFTYSRINCQTIGNKITIQSGFQNSATNTMTENDRMIPPTVTFTLPQFWNPRTMDASGAFSASILSLSDEVIYLWNQTANLTVNAKESTSITKGPAVQMSTAARPQRIIIDKASLQNGAITNYNFTVTPTNYLKEGDQITIQLPYPAFFSESSQCLAITSNLRINQTYKVNPILTTMTISLLLPLPKFRNLQGGSLSKISAGESFQFTLTQIKNPPSTEPTSSSIIYTTLTGGSIIEQLTTGLIIKNEVGGQLASSSTSIIPADFRPQYTTNYTLSFKPVNYVQDMRIVVQLPAEVSLGSNTVKCYGVQGTDSPVLKCNTDITKRQVEVTNAVSFQKGNPGIIKISFDSFKNPSTNIITKSFNLSTFTPSGYILDQQATQLTVNFFCAYPCLTCDSVAKTQCKSCYGGSDFSLWFNYTCLSTCNYGYINTTNNNCTACISPCATCKNSNTTCTSCINNYNLMEDKCVEIVYWPFPFLFMAIVSFFIILGSECITRRESRFKEAFIAMLAFPEIGSWITFLVFHYFRRGYLGSFALGSIAFFVYIIINLLHACIHPRLMVPYSLASYKSLISNYKNSTNLIRCLSYMFSFKFSLILVSYFCMQPRFKGDYSAVNWRQFNRFNLAFICLPFPTMMFAVCYYLYIDGIFSYAGFAAIEVIAISTVSGCLILLDAASALKCYGKPKQAVQPQALNQTGADYESEDDQDGKKLKKRRKENDEFGADEANGRRDDEVDSMASLRQSRVHHIRSEYSNGVDAETKQQIMMLEELARQMREEKEQLRLEKERIEREKRLYQEDLKSVSHQYEEKFSDLNERERYLNDSKAMLIGRLDQRFKQHDDSNQMMIRDISERQFQQSKMLIKKDYRNIEYEMDYVQPQPEDQIKNAAAIPMPVYGQVNYNKQNNDGKGLIWIRKVSPRAGGDSIMDQYSDRKDEGQIFIVPGKQPFYDKEENNADSIYASQNYLVRSNAKFSQAGTLKRDISEIFQRRSDAQMEKLDENSSENDINYEYFQLEDAYFGKMDGYEDLQADQQLNIANQKAHYELIDDKISRLGSEKFYFSVEQAAKGSAPALRQVGESIIGTSENYINNEAVYGQENQKYERIATPIEKFERDTASKGATNDVVTRIGSPLEFVAGSHPETAKQSVSNHSLKIRTPQRDFEGVSASQGVTEGHQSKFGTPVRNFEKVSALYKVTNGSDAGDELMYFQNVPAVYEDLQSHKLQKSTTPQYGFDKVRASQGLINDDLQKMGTPIIGGNSISASRGNNGSQSRIATPLEYYQNEDASRGIVTAEYREKEFEQEQHSPRSTPNFSRPKLPAYYDKEKSGLEREESLHQINQQSAQFGQINYNVRGKTQYNGLEEEQVNPDNLAQYSRAVIKTAEDIQQYFQLNDAKFSREGTRMKELSETSYEIEDKYLKLKKVAAKFELVEDDQSQQQDFIERENAIYSRNELERNRDGTPMQHISSTQIIQSRGRTKRVEDNQQYFQQEDAKYSREGTRIKELSEASYEIDPKILKLKKVPAQFEVIQDGKRDSQRYLDRDNAKYSNNEHSRSHERSQEYIEREPAIYSNNFDPRRIEHDTELDMKPGTPQLGSIKYSSESRLPSKQIQEQSQIRQPIILEDFSGHSESSEGIVDHNPFTSKQKLIDNSKKDLKEQFKIEAQNMNASSRNKAQTQIQPRKKNIIYSDKSESSIDEMMGDTPSNYNLANGRLDGKSLGLKAMLLQAQRLGNNTSPQVAKPQPVNQPTLQTISPRKPLQPPSNSKNQVKINQEEERKFVNQLHNPKRNSSILDQSRDGGWQNLSVPLGKGKVQIIDEPSENEAAIFTKKKQKAIKTNKTFAEEPKFGRNVLPQVTKNMIRKNNYI